MFITASEIRIWKIENQSDLTNKKNQIRIFYESGLCI